MPISPYKGFLLLLSLPSTLGTYFRRETGADYGVGLGAKLALVAKMIRNNLRIESGSNFVEHLMMATAILRVPRATDGCLVECGSFKGASATNLSLVAELTGRRLEIFDSFEGLPEPADDDRAHKLLHPGELHTYDKGGWAGTLDEVRSNISRYGSIGQCNFNKGFFDATLPGFEAPCVFAFVDVDLRDSLETCVENLWPQLADGAHFFTHEATHMEIASLFFEKEWWERLGSDPPGLAGAGTGLGLVPAAGGFGSAIGYAIKAPETVALEHVPQ